MNYEFVAPCHFGLEAVLKRELQDLGIEIICTEDGRITFKGNEETFAIANMFLRTCERILLKVGEFNATTFDELFEGTKALEWEKYIPQNGRFWVKKAAVEKLKLKYHKEWFSEDGEDFPIRVFIHKDKVLITIDTTGESLHKRGYRAISNKAPISETLAAALIKLSPWKADRILVDPFCGSGTFCIEAALMAANIAPGISREFLCQNWEHIIDKKIWYNIIEKANDLINLDIETDIQGYDIDADVIKIARHNAKEAGVEKLIHFQQRDVRNLSHPKKYGFIITNPPYGERLEDKKDLPELYKAFGQQFRNLDSWSAFFITSYEDAEKYFGGKATKNRKIYNGMIKTYFYQYLGPKPNR